MLYKLFKMKHFIRFRNARMGRKIDFYARYFGCMGQSAVYMDGIIYNTNYKRTL